MLPALSKAEVVFTAGLILSFLEMNGWADRSQHSQNIETLQQVVGGLIFAVTVIGWFVQHVMLVKHTTPAGQPAAEEKKFTIQPVLTWFTTVLRKPQFTATASTANTVIDDQPQE